VGREVAGRGDLAGAQEGVSAPPAPPLLLASTSPQRPAILEQLGVPFEVAPPAYEEADERGSDPVQLVREHARGKARSVAGEAGERPVLGLDTMVVCAGRAFGKPATAADAAEMLEALEGRVHEVVSGLCVVTPGWEHLDHDVTRVTFRPLTARDIASYLASGEWENRAGAYAIQGRGAALVERIEGDYLNVVGLPAARLVRLLSQRFAGVYGFG
jgi:septum formation protein